MLPIRIRQLPQFVKQIMERSRVLRQPSPGDRTFHLCYFSCRSYFPYLYCSLHSLAKHLHNTNFKALIFNDEEMPLSTTQIDAIKNLIPNSQVMPWPKSMGWGRDQIASIWRAYAFAAGQAADNDIIARIDSDVFFFNDMIFRAVSRSDADLIGDGHHVDFQYCQGGCYFFRASAVREICSLIEKENIDQLLSGIDIIVEDIAATHFSKQLGHKVWMTWFMLFPDELRNAGHLTQWLKWKFSCAHFTMKNKTAMLHAYERDILNHQIPENYKNALHLI